MKIDFGGGVCIEVAPGTSVLDASRTARLGHAHACGGRGRCTTCRVAVEAGAEHCPPPEAREAEALDINGLRPPVRLACQLVPRGDVRVRILIPQHISPARQPSEATEEQVAVLFTDIRGFTGFAESHLPFDTANVLNRYFDTMGVLVEGHAGQILDYLGDGIMSLFRPGDAEPACRAVACALAMRAQGESFCAYVQEHFGSALTIGAAVDCGRAVVGQLGYFRDRHLNAVGDVLNRVARLEQLNRDLETEILVTEDVAQACGERAQLGRSFAFKVRGRSAPITAWEVLGPGPGL